MKLAGRLLAAYARFVRRTSRVVIEPSDALDAVAREHPFVFAMWHGQFFMLPTLDRGDFPVSAMVARHGDAEVIGEMLMQFDMGLVRGAGAGGRKRNRGGAYALRTAMRTLRDGVTLAMTADVPPGPARRAGPGIVTLARLTGRPIVPFAVASSRYIALSTWSRLTINLPFSKLAYVVGEPIVVPANVEDDELDRYREAVEQELNRVTARAYELSGADMRRATPPTVDQHDTAQPLGFRIKAYRWMTSGLRLVAPVLLGFRSRQGKEDPARLSERYGQASLPRPNGPLVWMHAASVGETNCILPLVDRLLHERADLSILVTTGTVTSAQMAKRRLPERALHQFVPLDAPEYVARFLDHWRPELVVFTESEIWPNLIVEAHRRELPLALVNGRMSNRSIAKWRRNKGLAGPLFSRFSVILGQNEKFARAFGELGARRTVVAGNLKVDAPPPPVDAQELARLRAALGGRPVFVAASTRDSEEVQIANAHRKISAEVSGLCTIIAPRHPERGIAVAEELRDLGFKVALRSAGDTLDDTIDIYVADTIGELGTFYVLTGIAFVGGSLVPHGGQNPIEAIGHGATVLTGPHWDNFRDTYRTLIRRDGVIEVANADDIARSVIRLLRDEGALAAMRDDAKAALATMSGALDTTAEVLLELTPSAKSGARRAS